MDWLKQSPIEVTGEVLVNRLKELATILGQAKEEGQMLEYRQGLFKLLHNQSPSDPSYLFLPTLRPVLRSLVRNIRTIQGFPTGSIALPLAAVKEKTLYHFQRLRNPLAEKRRQQSKRTGAGFAHIAFDPNHPLPTPALIKAVSNHLIPSVAVWTKLYFGKGVIFSLLCIILDRNSKVVYKYFENDNRKLTRFDNVKLTHPGFMFFLRCRGHRSPIWGERREPVGRPEFPPLPVIFSIA